MHENRGNFENELKFYNEKAKETLSQVPQELLDNPFFQRPPENTIDQIKDIPKTIYYLQTEKQRIIQKLKHELSYFDSEHKETTKNTHGRFIIQEGKSLFWQKNEQEKIEITLGEILTDDSWGIIYNFDPNTVAPNTRKRYLIEQAKNQIRSIYDYQILISEANNKNVHEFKREAYKTIFARRQNKESTPGLIVEKMVENFLKKISIDYNVSFKIISADVAQDVDQKIDFIIHRKFHYLGVSIEADLEKNDIGVQFTSANSPLKLSEKRDQVERANQKLQYSNHNIVEDIVLVSIPMNKFMGAYQAWQKNKAPGGPDKFWSSETKKEVFTRILNGIFSSAKIEQEWEKIPQN